MSEESPTKDERRVSEFTEAFRGFWRALVRRRMEFLIAFVTTVFVVQIASFFWPADYVARAAILLQKSRYGTQLEAAGERTPTVISSGISEEEVNSEIAVLTSREVIDATVQATGIDKIEPSIWLRILFWPIWTYDYLHASWHNAPTQTNKDRAIRGFVSAISVEPLKDSNVLVVSFEAGNPEFAEIVLRNLIDNYMLHHINVHGRVNAQSFFETQADALKAELKANEEAAKALRRSIGSADLSVDLEIEQTKIAKQREEKELMQRNIAELNERIASYQNGSLQAGEGSMQTTTLEGRNELVLQTMTQQKLQIELERVRLLERYKSDSPLLVENERKISAADEAMRGGLPNVSQTQSALSPAAEVASRNLEVAKADRAGYRERIVVLDQQLDEAHQRLALLDEKSLEARRFDRLIETSEAQYLQYLDRSVEERINAALDRDRFTNASVVQEATAEIKPIRPKKLITLLLSLGGGLIAAFGTVIILELWESGLESFVSSVAPRGEEV